MDERGRERRLDVLEFLSCGGLAGGEAQAVLVALLEEADVNRPFRPKPRVGRERFRRRELPPIDA